MFNPESLPKELEVRLQEHCQRTADYFASFEGGNIEAVILGGGYGRGEGGVLIEADGSAGFYNDFDYFIFAKNPGEKKLSEYIRLWEIEESAKVGIDVEGKSLHRSELEQAERSMMFFDLVSGYKVVWGPGDYLKRFEARVDGAKLDLLEATRLLWNRGTGLFYAQVDLMGNGDLSVVHRNQSKLKLALGDALLAVNGRYGASVRERADRVLASATISDEIKEYHVEGARFKLRPTQPPGLAELRATQDGLRAIWKDTYLRVEGMRLGEDFVTAADYAGYKGALYPDYRRLKCLLIHFRDQIRRGGGLKPCWDYPRGGLQRALLLLLEDEPDFPLIGHYLGGRYSRLEEARVDYERWWHCYS